MARVSDDRTSHVIMLHRQNEYRLQSPTVPTSSTRDFIGRSPLYYPGYVALSKKESSRERRSVTMVRSSRIFRTKCRYITDATENFVTWRG